MTPNSPDLEDRLRDAMRRPVDVDTPRLVAGIRNRARRKRRAALAVRACGVALAVGMVAAAITIPLGSDLLGSGPAPGEPTDPTSSAVDATEEPTTEEPTTPGDDPTAEEGDGSVNLGPTPGPTPSGTPPFQLQEPESFASTPGNQANEWFIPDPRPTGIAALDQLALQTELSGVHHSPIGGLQCADIGTQQAGDAPVSPVGVQAWWHGPVDAAGRWTQDGGIWVAFTVSGWQDASAALEVVRACDWAPLGTALPEQDWPGRVGGDWLVSDLGLVTTTELEQHVTGHGAVALVRTGAYLLAVTVVTDDGAQVDTVELARTVAEQGAANLEFLDPARTG